MKKKLFMFLLFAICSFAMFGCDSCKKSFTVTYKSVVVTEVEPAEDAPEGTESTYTYENTVVGTEVVEKGKKITGVAVDAEGTKYIADKYYTAQEVNKEDAPVYDAEAAVEADLTLYAEKKHYAVAKDLATGSGYTLNYAITVFPTTWNSHIYETDTDSTILDYSATGFYEFDYNENKDGYRWVDGMAVGDPKDVTADYVGEEWGIAEDDTARAWEITLRDDLCWDDGTPITSEDFYQSALRLLEPKAQNSRADDYMYSGNLVIHNAENYILQGQFLNRPFGNYYATIAEAKAAAAKDNNIVTLDLKCVNDYLVEWVGAGLDVIMKPANEGFLNNYFAIYEGEGEARAPKKDENGKIISFFSKYNLLEAKDGLIELTDEMIEDYSNCDGFNPDPDGDLGVFCSLPVQYAEMEFDKVGVKATAPNKLVYIIDKELSGFYLKYSLSSYLVKTDVYDECDNLDANGDLPEGEVYKSSYCTDATNSPSYGPYKLTEYQLNKYFKVEKNTNWWAYKGSAKDLYQCTAVVYTMAESASTRLQMFLSGKFDSYGLTSEDMEDYQSSDYTYFTDGDSTWFIAFNPDADKFEANEWTYDKDGNKLEHKKIDKQIISIKEFRQALSYALDRAAYELACDPTGNVAKALFSPMIISDPENGTVYRNTDEAKQAIVQFWGLANDIGAGKLYANIDDAIASITGYNPAMAKDYFNKAYDKAVELGYIKDDEVVEVCIGTSNLTSNYYNKGYDFLVNCYTEAVKGTKLEGKLTFTRDGTLGNDYAKALQGNKVDMLFGVGWTGSALDPYGLIEAYTTYDKRYNTNTDFSKMYATVTLPVSFVEGIESTEMADYTANVADWTATLKGTKIKVSKGTGEDTKTFEVAFGTTVEYALRGKVLAAVELAALNQFDMLPIAYDSSASLKSMKINFYTEEYVYGVGRGGIKYMTFNYTDSEWAAYVSAQNGKLNYKASSGE